MATANQINFLNKIARDEMTVLNGAAPESAADTLTWTDGIIETAEDKGTATSLINAGLIGINGNGREGTIFLTDEGFAVWQAAQ